jgi:hypothetical protein
VVVGELMDKNKEWYGNHLRRITEENGGAPPSEGQFYKKTDSKLSDWRDKPWNRWNNFGDILEEFGLQRGRLNQSYDRLELLRMLTALTQSLEHFPSQRDLRRKRREDPAFPTDSTIRNHFGERSGVVRELIDFCANRPEYSRALEICSNEASMEPVSVAQEPIEDDETRKGYVYLIKGRDGYHVGMTTAPYDRVSTIIKSLPHGGELVHYFATDDRRGIERYWQNRWRSRQIERLNATPGEWFKLSSADIAAFKRRKKYM